LPFASSYHLIAILTAKDGDIPICTLRGTVNRFLY
jgi:hypothetical protein